MNKEKATLTCPYCQRKQTVDIPQTGCLAFYKCDNCGQTPSVPPDSDSCCVICEYSDTTCPIGHKK